MSPSDHPDRAAWDEAENTTAHNTRITLSVAFNYGGRWDVVQACRQAIAQGLAAEQIDERRLSSLMALAHAPDPDLFIRTGGEVRISNFLLWQVAYAELYFTECLWPDFDEAELDAALAAYAGRERRFGDVRSRAGSTPGRWSARCSRSAATAGAARAVVADPWMHSRSGHSWCSR